jgi:hypothetical protein
MRRVCTVATIPPEPGKPRTEADGGMMGARMMDGMSCSQMMSGADVTVQNTKDGATIRMRAKSKDQVQHVQHMAQMMKSCMSGEQR